MVHEIALPACRTKPLSSYLKAIAVLRLVSEQGKDPDAKGYWRDDVFVLRTWLDKEALMPFFCEEYSPTPIVAPWNGGSGFYPADAMQGIRSIMESGDTRFASYREVIGLIKSWPEMPKTFESIGDITLGLTSMITDMRPGKKRAEIEKLLAEVRNSIPSSGYLHGKTPSEALLSELEVQSKKKGDDALKRCWSIIKKARTECTSAERGGNKEVILALCRSRLPEKTLQWLDALCVMHPDRKPSYSPILGTGGNEGRLDFSNNFMQQTVELLLVNDPDITRRLLSSALFGTALPGLQPGKLAQYDPGRAGGFNQGMEVETKDFKINAWDYVLMLEGTLLFSSALVRRTETGSHIASPFTVDFSPVGFTSSEYGEAGRQEIWLPLWKNAASYEELKYLLGEGRCILGTKQARTGLDFSRGIGTLGVDRGIEAFERYAFLERRGKSYVALPAGRHAVRFRENLEYLSELDQVTTPLDRFLDELNSLPASFLSARRRIDESLYTCTNDPSPHSFTGLVSALGRMEKLLAARDRTNKPSLQKPLLGLSLDWIMLCDNGRPEVRIAAALSSIHATGKVGPIRTNLAGVDPQLARKWGDGNAQHVWLGNTLPERLGKVACRRMLDAERFLSPTIPFEAHLCISPHDVMPFLRDETDDNEIEDLLWGFTLIDWWKSESKKVYRRWRAPVEEEPVSRLYALLKLLHLPAGIRGKSLRKETRIVHLLEAGRIDEACRVAIYRLRVSELKPFDVVFEERLDPRRLLASLLIPTTDQWKLESLVLESESKDI
ncbi:MAG TPA: type I-U CRISPR-associated protein Csx17 [Syntrophobacteraceae bacterium]|nr:type I-U CRISPR-associated protein Csx17 [Syntrophobacteraceae bacterium]